MKRKTFNLLLINLLILTMIFSYIQFSSSSNSILWTFIPPAYEVPNQEIAPSFSENLMWNYTLGGRVYGVAVSNDSEYIVAGSGNNRVYLYYRNGTLKWSYLTGGSVETVDISEDGYYIVAGSYDNKVYLFNRTSSTPMWSYLTGDDVRYSVAISTNGDYIVAGSRDNKVYLFNKSSSTPMWSYLTGGDVCSVDVSSDGQYIVAGSSDSKIYVFNRSNSDPLWNYTTLSSNPVVTISPDGQCIACGSSTVCFFSINSSTPIWTRATGGSNYFISMSSDAQYITTGNFFGYLYLWHKNSSTELWNCSLPDRIYGVDISADGKYIAAGTDDGDKKLYYFTRESNSWIWSYQVGDLIYPVAISSNGTYIAAGSRDNNIYFFNYTAEAPTSNHPNNITVNNKDSKTINWTLYDDVGGGEYRVWANDTNNNYYIWVDWASWDNDTPLNVPINRTAAGVFNYTIEYDDNENQTGISDTVIVTVTDTDPTSNHPADIITSASGTDTIGWILYDDYGTGQYRVWVNDTNDIYYIWQDWTPWANNTNLNIPINRTSPGIFNYTIEFNDSADQLGIPDMVIVTVQDGIPTSNHPNDIITSASGLETIDWVLYDDFGPGQYRVWTNDTNNNYYVWVDWIVWTNNSALNIQINRTAPGTYNYTIEYYDLYNQFGNPDTVIVIITDANPISNHPDDIVTTSGGAETIDWILYDDFGQGQYRVWANDTSDHYYVWQNWAVWTNNTNLQVPINRTASGIFNFTIEYYDLYNVYGTPDTVIVNVSNAAPTSNSPGDLVTTAGGSETIDWVLYDDFGSGQYRVWVNDTGDHYYVWQNWAVWTNNTNLQVPINRTASGIFNFTIEYYDMYNKYGISDVVIVNVSNAAPTANTPSDIVTLAVLGSETIGWRLYDDFGSGQYRVWVNDTSDNYYVWVDWTAWVNDTILNVPINRTFLGIYNYTIEFYDMYNKYGNPDTVIVNVTNSIPTSNSPNDISTTASGIETIDWRLYDDVAPGQYRVWANNTNGQYYIWLDWNTWTNDTLLNVPINRTAPGLFNYTIEYYDSFNTFGIPDTVIVTITDSNPTSNQPSDIMTSVTGSETIDWILYDDFGPGQYRVWLNDTNDMYYVWVDWTAWTNNTIFNVPINRSTAGVFNYTIEYYDSYNNYGVSDTVLITVVEGIPTSNHPSDIITTESGMETIGWILCDDFGSGYYCVWIDNMEGSSYLWINWTAWDNNTLLAVPINRTALGAFNYTIVFNSSSGQISKDTVIVIISRPSEQPRYENTPIILTIEEPVLTYFLTPMGIGIVTAILSIPIILTAFYRRKKPIRKKEKIIKRK